MISVRFRTFAFRYTFAQAYGLLSFFEEKMNAPSFFRLFLKMSEYNAETNEFAGEYFTRCKKRKTFSLAEKKSRMVEYLFHFLVNLHR